MTLRSFLFIAAIGLVISSCIPSLYPLYRTKDLKTNNKLEGRFSDGELDYWEIQHLSRDIARDMKGGWRNYQSGYTYKLTVMEDGESEQFALHLLELGGNLYMDFFPVDYKIKHDFLDMHLSPAHMFAKAEINEESLILHFLDVGWFEELIDENRIKISHLKIGYRYILTAKTDELQKFVNKFAHDSSFVEADTLPRMNMAAMAADIESNFK